MIKVYVAGPMTGKKDFNFPAFDKAKELLESQGFAVVSPADMDREKFPEHDWTSGTTPEGFNYQEALLYDLIAIKHCQAVYFLPGWHSSIGAQIEYEFTAALQLPRYFLSPEDLTFPESVV